MQDKLAIFAMNRQNVGWSQQIQHQLQFFLGRMTGNVYIGNCLVIHFSSLAKKVIDGAVDHFLVARHRCSRENNRIILLNAHQSVILVSNACESRGWFSLATSTDDDNTLWWKFVNIFRTDEHTLRYVQVSKVDRHLHIVDHTAPYKGDHALVATSSINDLLHTRKQVRKGSYDNTPRRISENFVERIVNDTL